MPHVCHATTGKYFYRFLSTPYQSCINILKNILISSGFSLNMYFYFKIMKKEKKEKLWKKKNLWNILFAYSYTSAS